MKKFLLQYALILLSVLGFSQTTYTVTNTNDEGSGSLREAMTLAEGTSGADVIDMTGISGTITLGSALPDITQDLTINGPGSADLAIDGADTYRIFFIVNETAPTVVINDLTLQNGLAKGEDTRYGGAGAGMGGAIYADNANLSLENVVLDGNTAQGGNGGVTGPDSGGAGPFDTGGSIGSNGPNGNPGGTGGFGSGGGVGGSATVYGGGANGGGGTGGFGAGAGAPGVANFQAPGTSPGGTGGTFGGSTNSFNGSSSSSSRSGGGGGGLGGALFVRSGSVEMDDVTLSNNQASKGLGGAYSNDGQGKGGALFLMDGVTAEGVRVSFNNNTASDAGEDDSDNDNNYGTLNILTNIVIESNPENDEISEGEDVVFSVAVTGSGATYQWQVNDGSNWADLEDDAQISGADTEELSLTCLDFSWDQYQFRCVAEGTLNTETSEAATLTVNAALPLEVTITGPNYVLCGAQENTFTAVAGNVETTPAYQWLVNGEEIEEETNESFTYEVSPGDQISVILNEPGSCYTRTAATSEIITIEESDIIAVTTDASSGNGSFAWAIDLANAAACDQTVTVDLTGLPDNSTINISGILITASRLKIVGPGRDLLRFEDTTPSGYSISSQDMEYLEMSGFELFHDQENTSDGLRLESSMTILSEIAVSGYTQNGISTVSMDNDFDQLFLSDNSKGILFYSSQLGGQTSSEVPASVSLTNSEFDNNETSVFINDFQSFTTSTIENVVIKNNQDEYDGGLQINLYNSSGSFTTTHYITNVSFINAYASGANLNASDGNDQIIAHFTNCTFSGNGIRSYDDNLDSETTYISALANKNSEAILTNCTFAQNAIAISYDEVSGGSALSTIKNSIFVGNTISNVYTSTGEATVTESNNIGYPTFSGVASDVINTTLTDPSGTGLLVHELITCTSPALDAGDDSVAPETDQLGNARSGISDLGAVESLGFINTQPQDLKDFLGNEASFTVVASAEAPTYQWQVSTGGEYTDLADDATYSGTQTSELTIAALSDNLDGYSYRVVINGLCENISSGALLDVLHYPTSDNGSIEVQEDITYEFQTSDFIFDDLDGDGFAGILIESVTGDGTLLYDGTSVILEEVFTDISLLTFDSDQDENGSNYASFTFRVISDYSETEISQEVYTMTINVNNTNDAPTDITLSNASIDENNSAGEVIGTLSTIDIDENDSFTYSLVAGTGDTDNSSFTVDGNTLRASASFDFEVKNSLSLRLSSSDGEATFEKVFIIDVNDINDAPTDITLSNANIDENNSIDAMIGTLSTTDNDEDDSFIYSLIAGAGDTDNSFFTIDDNILRASISFDFEVKNSLSLRLSSSDGEASVEKVFVIDINNSNDAPTDIALSNTSIDENNSVDAAIGTLSTTDIDENDSFTYSLVAGTGDTDNSSFNIDGNTLRASASFDFEVRNSFSLRLSSSDGEATVEKVFVIDVNNTNDAPTDISLSNASIEENNSVDAVIGTLSTTDNDEDDSFTYSLTTGTGDTDNSSFIVDGNVLRASATFDFEVRNSLSLRLSSSDGEATVEKVFEITVVDVEELSLGVSNQNVTIYPNPVQDFLTIQGVDFEFASVFNIQGHEVLRATTKIISLRELAEGVHIIRLFKEGKMVHEQKLIVN